MALGYSVGGVCFSTSAEAVDAYYSNIPPSILQTATTAYKLHYLYSGGSWLLQKQTISSTGALTTNYTIAVPTNVYGSCALSNDPATNFFDGMTLGWGVAAAMIFAWAIWVLRRGL